MTPHEPDHRPADPAAPIGSDEWRAAMVARLAERMEAASRRCRARAKRPRLKTNTAGGLPPCRPSDDRPNPPTTEGIR